VGVVNSALEQRQGGGGLRSQKGVDNELSKNYRGGG